MESNFRNRDFEDYVKQNADQYRMFPSEKVWKSINNTLHTRRKWYGFGLGFLLLLTGTAVTWVMVSYPVSRNQTTAVNNTTDKITPAGNQQPISLSTAPVAPEETPGTAKVIPFTSNNIASVSAKPSSMEVMVENAGIETFLNTEEPLNKPVIAFIPQELPSARTEKLPVAAMSAPSIDNHPLTLISFVNEADPAVTANVSEDKTATQQEEETKPVTSLLPQYPLSIESVTNSYQKPKLGKKIIWQVFVTPTISYRKLDENKSFDNSSGLSYPFASLTDVNKAVIHKPDMGVQLGVSAAYPVTSSLRIRGGLQFNVNRYDIKAFPSNPEVASINLTAASNGVNSVSTWTPYRNYGGYKSDWLKNFYYSISIPVGIELKLIGNKKTSFGIAGTLQPTYIVKDRAYLLSTDYKNYAQVPWLTRHVNLNTGFETFVNYTTGKTRWQVGPQVRYQVMSSYHNKYPVKENLFDFGIKVGVSLNE